MPRLVITKGPSVGRDHAVGTECVIGRAPEVDFPIEDGGISRRHCRVRVEGDGYLVEDLGSRNGTMVNGARVQAAPLSDGSLIRIGGVELMFRQVEGVTSPPAARAAAVVAARAAAGSATTPAPVPAPAPEKKYDVKPGRRRTGW
jgi:pSer/pThr/pTyr-binding forkhead associated (FHA) protein